MKPRKEIIGDCTLYLGTMEETIGGIERVDHVLTDPPYLYIKTHDFDREWDEQLFFENAKRFLPDDGFIALFGRGTSFYRWNTRLADLGFAFKEEIVWDKRFCSSPVTPISRTHETISIYTKKSGKIRKNRIPYLEQKKYDTDGIVNDIKRIKSAINNEAGLNRIIDFLKTGNIPYGESLNCHKVTIAKETVCKNPEIMTVRAIRDGIKEKSVIALFKSHVKGNVHPTEKPVRLAERILALISDPGDTIYDPFMGSGSFGVACINTGRKYIGSEMKPEYFETACKRIEESWNKQKNQPELFPGTAERAAAVGE
ncbi:MAG: site-specific DNA-methyltransferase [Treponema sp.]|jgi:site-specific DNA-methyltransferase (adenine-specific)|nr:site-specific DNA-methyltransferase [Treponema sp.]